MMPEQATIVTVGVESVDESLKKIVEAGGTITQLKQAVPGIGYVAYCTDQRETCLASYSPTCLRNSGSKRGHAKETQTIEMSATRKPLNPPIST